MPDDVNQPVQGQAASRYYFLHFSDRASEKKFPKKKVDELNDYQHESIRRLFSKQLPGDAVAVKSYF
jgi:hypothetical protein